ncbi:MAG: hypothetical protein RIR66_121 [Actinomycetota bacterium]
MKQVSSIAAVDLAESILKDAHEEITVETRIEKLIEVTDGIKFEQEHINLIDRIRNTESEITLAINCPSFPIVNGSIRFTSERFLVISNNRINYFVNLSHSIYLAGVDQRAVFRIENSDLDTTSMWVKNLVENQSPVSIYLINGNQLSGKLIRFGNDHLDLLVGKQSYLIPITSLVLLRSTP